MNLHHHEILNDPAVRHGWTDSGGPDFKGDPASPDHGHPVSEIVEAARLVEAAWAHQVHGGKVLHVKESGLAGEADALWTDVPGLGVIGRSADCPLVLVAGRREDGSALTGFAHASWRSTVKGITGKLLGQMIAAGLDPATARAVICPSAGPCCYEVGEDVREAALSGLGQDVGWHFLDRGGIMTFNLWAANKAQLEEYGMASPSIAEPDVCTICGEGFPSYRRDGEKAGRFAAIIGPGLRA